MPTTIQATATNRLLIAMPHKLHQSLLEDCELVYLTFNEVLVESGERIRHVYFPTESIISLVMPIDSHVSLGVGMVGDEGMLGISLILGVDISPFRCIVQGAGLALRMKTTEFQHHLKRKSAMQQVLRHHLYIVNNQLAQNAACSHFHMVETRLARWLLMTHDRTHSQTFYVTHEFLANMLGVRRVGVTKAATSLQKQKLIEYSRGEIKVINRDGLEEASCGCYAADIAMNVRMMGENLK